jgi:hypothetical protein
MSDNKSIAGVFIIESLQLTDEEKGLYEGKIISSILQLNKVPSKYYYIRTAKEFREVLKIFDKLKFRYLHISCHGDGQSLSLTLDSFNYTELGRILEPYLRDKRLFISDCSSVNKKVAWAVIPASQCYSLIGPQNDIEFRDAAVIWASFYHLMFKQNASIMVREHLVSNIQKVVNTFGQPMNYFSRSRTQTVSSKSIEVQDTRPLITESEMIE